MPSTSNLDSEYDESKPKQKKRRKNESVSADTPDFAPLLSALWTDYADESKDDAFDQFMQTFLEDFLQSRQIQADRLVDVDELGKKTRPLRKTETVSLLEELAKKDHLSIFDSILSRKIKLERERSHACVRNTELRREDSLSLTIAPVVPPPHPVNEDVLTGLSGIRTTPFSNSFLSRLDGTNESSPQALIAIDWETRTPWMDLMTDIHDHYAFSHPDAEQTMLQSAPITYSTLRANQLPQIHDLLERSFWTGIDVRDSLDYQPERSTVIAMYKKIVVGVAIIASPLQTYITYLAVKAGWDKAQIGRATIRTMLYHLIALNPDKDFTLHVSTNSSAMLLYNQFGFKAEEFVAGFYSEYLDPESRASKNAFKLRLRHL
ncbi:hypothetical protein M413DRAFT_66849 [Hebeloma cylindrosporum]|uniref:N-acetyltransferase domain-containing protein n=1 Tax=Hebeloma cylindrosporum TaxID=76867 RepID=A0A0C2Y4K6_HEBCY|nr:hypothetical protein M413DRAFT_66849 [Hebeloma cylindrosporum h7]